MIANHYHCYVQDQYRQIYRKDSIPCCCYCSRKCFEDNKALHFLHFCVRFKAFFLVSKSHGHDLHLEITGASDLEQLNWPLKLRSSWTGDWSSSSSAQTMVVYFSSHWVPESMRFLNSPISSTELEALPETLKRGHSPWNCGRKLFWGKAMAGYTSVGRPVIAFWPG
jgi:hypothetical protein